jgi:hypothetical protein
MRSLHLLAAASVAVALVICKPSAAADEPAQADEGFKLGGYASAGINIQPGGHKEAQVDEVSLILKWEGNSRFRFFTEMEVEDPVAWEEGEAFPAEGSHFDLERFYVDYNLSEKLNLRAGRFLTPAGRWNLIHAAPLVWTTSRPLATSRLFPLSTNGLMFFGAAPVGNKAFEYTFFVEGLEDQYEDDDEIEFEETRGARFTLSGDSVSWGLSLLEFREEVARSPDFDMVGLDFMASHKGWEFSGEAFQRFYSDNDDGGNGAYLQAVAPLGNHWFAVGRLENFERPLEGSTDRWVLGTAWRMKPSQVLKLEYSGGNEDHPESPRGFLASFAILF